MLAAILWLLEKVTGEAQNLPAGMHLGREGEEREGDVTWGSFYFLKNKSKVCILADFDSQTHEHRF